MIPDPSVPTRRATAPPVDETAGFSLVELVIALLILTVGVLGLAGTTAYVIRQVDAARINSDRTAALQSAVEYVRSIPYDNLSDSSMTVGRYAVSWEVSPSRYQRIVRIVTVGPGAAITEGGSSVIRPAVADTFQYQVVQP